MPGAVAILGIGSAEVHRGNAREELVLRERLASLGAAFEREGRRVRLFHRVEETAFLAAWEAARAGGIPVPSHDDRASIVLGVDEGIDGIRARHSLALRDDGPAGVSPLSFPFTSHNAVTAQVSIGLDLRGESFTFCGGTLSGAAALWAARGLLLDGRASVALAGGATSVEKEFLEGLETAGAPDPGEERDGACILALGPWRGGEARKDGGHPVLVGYGSGFGKGAVRDAVDACLDDAGVLPGDVTSVWSATPDPGGEEDRGIPALLATARRSPSADMYAAAFPLAIAAALREVGRGSGRTALVVGWDCLSGSAAALVRG